MSLFEATDGRLNNLTAEQQLILNEFKTELGEVYESEKHSDHLLLRFLRARQFKLEAAKYSMPSNYCREMFVKCQEWRKEYGTDTILTDFDFPEYVACRKLYPRIYHKCDKLGRPLYIERVGIVDVKNLWAATTSERMVRNHVREITAVSFSCLQVILRPESAAKRAIVILSKGVALTSFRDVYSLVTEVSSMGQNYYPELLGKMFIINAPMLFTAVWTVVKRLLDENTVKKISILGSSYKKQLLEYIDIDQLPDFLGGDCRCQGGCSMGDVGPWNDGTVEGYPLPEMEKFLIKYAVI